MMKNISLRQSLVDEIIKDEVIGKYSSENIFDPLEINNLSQIIRDVRLFRTKIRVLLISMIIYLQM